ncbi:MAG: ATPase [Candidatus Methanogaster sp.]|uniref:ATPase n=1 Tax=Candidatus Methanogaster sp. TaxID=3386292 RepID=A0AC61L0T0_9EURY|nr:MAG: ATPase [ANME-2 cluster archaeon]
MSAAANNWLETNQRYLSVALAVVRSELERHAARSQDASDVEKQHRTVQTEQALAETAAAMSVPPAIETLCAVFGLSPFERDLLLLCAGMELDSTFPSVCAAAQGDPSCAYPSFSLALAALPDPHWSAITPGAPLRHWRLIEVGAGSALATSPLRIDEQILHYLTGVSYLDERLAGFVEPLRLSEYPDLVPSHQALAERLASAWQQEEARSAFPVVVVQLCGGEASCKREIALSACRMLGLNLNAISANFIPTIPAELDALIRLCEREAALGMSALLLDCDDLNMSDAARGIAITQLVERTNSPLIVTSQEPLRTRDRPMIVIDVGKPTSDEQREIWESVLGLATSGLNGNVDALVSQYNLSARTIRDACAEVAGCTFPSDTQNPIDPDGLGVVLWDACRMQARPRMSDLAQRIEPAATWDGIVLPEPECQILRDIAVHVRERAKVYEDWGFAAKSASVLGISALFAGASGTGKTMAAEVLANELRLDLYRIDLSQVVSKYIGETEKNLRRVFDAAEEGGAILLFDEADALFGKRSEVKDSHDRYANIEISYLLQRMEAYRGLAILTTNMKSAIDTAFLRRIRFIVHFPFPDATQRGEIWERIFPASTPTDGLDASKLSRLNIAGGNIRNIALNAAFLAANAREDVGMKHLLRAARSEYAKMEKPLTEAEIGGWV